MSDEPRDPRLVEAEIARHIAEADLARAKAEAERATFEWNEWSRKQHLAKAENNNIYTLFGAINDSTVGMAMMALGEMSRRSRGAPIEIVFDSPGGSVFAGLALFDFIQTLKESHHVATSTVGMAASMGGILLQAGDERIAGRNSFMLIHEVSSGSMGKVSDMEDSVKFANKLQDRLVGILAERSTLTERQIKARWKKTDWWLDSTEMLELGFIDRVR